MNLNSLQNLIKTGVSYDAIKEGRYSFKLQSIRTEEYKDKKTSEEKALLRFRGVLLNGGQEQRPVTFAFFTEKSIMWQLTALRKQLNLPEGTELTTIVSEAVAAPELMLVIYKKDGYTNYSFKEVTAEKIDTEDNSDF